MSCFDFVFPEDIDEARKLLEANKLPHAKPFRFRLRRVDGSEVWTDIQGSALQTAQGGRLRTIRNGYIHRASYWSEHSEIFASSALRDWSRILEN